MAESVALEISEDAVYAVALEGGGRKVRVIGSYTAPISAGGSTDRNEQIKDAIEEIFRENKLDRSKVVVSLPSRSCVIRQLWLPFKKADQIAKTIPFEVESQLQSCDLSNMVFSYAKIRETERKSEVLVAAVPREEVENYLDLLKSCRIDPLAIDLDVAALYNAARRSSIGRDGGSLAVVDLAPACLRIVVIHDGDLRVGRSVALSPAFVAGETDKEFLTVVAREIRRTLVAAGGDGPAAVRNARLDAGGGVDAQDQPNAAAPLSPLSVHAGEATNGPVHRPVLRSSSATEGGSLGEGGSGSEAKRQSRRTGLCPVLLTGAVGGLPGIESSLSERLGLPIRCFDFVGELSDNGLAASSHTVALGSGHKGLGSDLLKIDFRKGDYVYKTGFELIKRPLAAVASLALILFMILGLYMREWVANENVFLAEIMDRKRARWTQTDMDPKAFNANQHSLAAYFRDKHEERTHKSDAEIYQPSPTCSMTLKNINDAFSDVANNSDPGNADPDLYAKDIYFTWSRGGVDVKIRGRFGKAVGAAPWKYFKAKLAELTNLDVVERDCKLQRWKDASTFDVHLTSKAQ